MKYFIVILLLSLLPRLAFARPFGGAGAANSGLKSPDSLYGLCSQDDSNLGQRWTMNDSRLGKSGLGPKSFCDDIDETLQTQKGCDVGAPGGGKKLDANAPIAEQLRQNPKFVDSLKEACGDKIAAIQGDQTKFNLFLKQLFAVLTIQENQWKSNPVSSMGAKGLMQLDKNSVKAYGKCNEACKTLGQTGDFKSARGDHLTMQCGVTIGLYWMGRDETMGNGSGNKGSRGLARYYQPFRKIDKSNRAWMMGKLKKYCNERIDKEGPSSKPASGGSVTTMNEYWDYSRP